MKRYVMALDQGTTSSRCILFDRQGRICSMARKELAQQFPQPGYVEQDPLEIWSSQLSVAVEAVEKLHISMNDIAAIGITNQRETTIVWEKATGKPVYPAIVWQCRRTAGIIDAWNARGYGDVIREKTGLVPDAYFSASKIVWILDHVEGARERAEAGELLFGTVDTWLIWNLTGGAVFATDYTNASRTMLFDIYNLRWDPTLLEWFGIPACMLPQVRPSSSLYGMTECPAFSVPIPITGAAGDQQAALFGQCCFASGDVKNTYGTGCFLLMHTGTKPVVSQNGLLTTMAASTSETPEYALEGSVFVGGAAVQWLRDGLKLVQTAAETEEAAKSVEDTQGVYVVPAFTGLGAPYWDPYARGMIVGVTRGCTRTHLIRSVLESIAYQVSDLLHCMEQDTGVSLTRLQVDGGACANDFLMQFQADILNASVLRPECIETTALGAAYLAGLAVGFYESKAAIRENQAVQQVFESQMRPAKREQLLRGWKKAVRCALEWAREE